MQRDYELVCAARDGGNRKAYADLMAAYRDPLYSLLLRMTRNTTVAADLTIEMLRRGKAEHVTGIDLSDAMMAIGKEKVDRLIANSQKPIAEFIHANAQHMPFSDASFDGVTCAFGCRNFSDLDAGLREMYRVLKSGGQVTILEFSYPSNRLVRWAYDLYFTHILPLVGRLVSKDKTAYTYLNRSVKSFCWGEAFVQHLHDAGFTNEHFLPLTLGIATVYTAQK